MLVCFKYPVIYFHQWLVDSGASRHICSNASEFTSIRPIQHSTVILPNHTSIPVHFSGEVKLNNHLTPHDVLYVPRFKYNLLSVSALSNVSQLIFTFFPNHFIIQDLHHKKTIGRDNKHGDLYFIDRQTTELTTTDTPSVITINYADAATWHSRLGDLSDQRLAILQDKLHCNMHSIHKNKICCICPLAKQKRLPFVSYNKIASSPFELVYCAIWGPFHIISHTGHQFFVTLVDDYTRFTWTFLLKHKSDVQLIVPRFVRMIHTQFEENQGISF